ncbi:hypothetical protein M9434_003349 [Picochlorum sp. BPE23]|nr:hypothetical protein M9434_003349 [Picochlorum sp. BPE23]
MLQLVCLPTSGAPGKRFLCSDKRHCSRSVAVQATQSRSEAGILLGGLAASLLLMGSPMSLHAESNTRLPPLDTDPNRCERATVGNTIGQANAVSDKILDLRFCDFTNKDLSTKTLSGALLADAILKGANLQEAVMSKAYAVGANFAGADMTNAVVDRVVFDKADLSNVKFVNAVITGATFDGANLDGADFEDALIGSEDAKRLCSNPTITAESKDQIGCRGK